MTVINFFFVFLEVWGLDLVASSYLFYVFGMIFFFFSLKTQFYSQLRIENDEKERCGIQWVGGMGNYWGLCFYFSVALICYFDDYLFFYRFVSFLNELFYCVQQTIKNFVYEEISLLLNRFVWWLVIYFPLAVPARFTEQKFSSQGKSAIFLW